MRIVSYIMNENMFFGHLYNDQRIINLSNFSKKEFNVENVIDFIAHELYTNQLVKHYIDEKKILFRSLPANNKFI